jgi:hypothetical protein
MEMLDPYTTTELPADVIKLAISLDTVEAQGATEPELAVLDRWDVVTHQYRREAAIKVGFFAQLFQGTGKVVQAGVTQEAKQYRVGKTDKGREVQARR